LIEIAVGALYERPRAVRDRAYSPENLKGFSDIAQEGADL